MKDNNSSVKIRFFIYMLILFILYALQLNGNIEWASKYVVLLSGCYTFIIFLQEWNKHRILAILSICLSIYMFIETYKIWFTY